MNTDFRTADPLRADITHETVVFSDLIDAIKPINECLAEFERTGDPRRLLVFEDATHNAATVLNLLRMRSKLVRKSINTEWRAKRQAASSELEQKLREGKLKLDLDLYHERVRAREQVLKERNERRKKNREAWKHRNRDWLPKEKLNAE